MNAAGPGPRVDDGDVTFTLLDADRQFEGVSLLQELRRPRVGPPLERDAAGVWSLTLARPDVDRMEYRFGITDGAGLTEAICDPHNPRRAPGPFGEKSVIEWPEYRAPAWLDADLSPGSVADTEVRSRVLRSSVPVRLWSADGAEPEQKLPLLVVHDGMDYERYAALLVLLAGLVNSGVLPPLRAALLTPIHRNRWYSASPLYARALMEEILPQLARLAPAPPSRARIGMGASLGALAMLHAQREHPESFGALFLQSGSFFTFETDGHESGVERFRQITRYVKNLLTTPRSSHSIRVVMTCGTVEENLANNRNMHDALAEQGYKVSLLLNRDAHNWIAWRDAFEPPLVELLLREWAA